MMLRHKRVSHIARLKAFVLIIDWVVRFRLYLSHNYRKIIKKLPRLNLRSLTRKYASTVGLGLVVSIILVNGINILQTGAANAVLVPNSDVTSEWPVVQGGGGTHYGAVDEGVTPDTNSYIGTGTGDQNGAGVQQFGMTTASSIDEATSITLNMHVQNFANTNNGRDDIVMRIHINDTVVATDTVTPPDGGAWTWYDLNITGTWNQSDIDSMEVSFEQIVNGGGPGGSRQDDLRISTVYVDLEYSVSVLTEQSSYRWFENEDGITSLWIEENDNPEWFGRANHGTVVFNDQLWVIGGKSNWGFEESYGDVYSSADGINWSYVSDINDSTSMWTDYFNFSIDVYDNRIWIVGGIYRTDTSNNWAVARRTFSSTDGETWTYEGVATSLPNGVQGHASVVYDNYLWVLGGHTSSNVRENHVHRFDGEVWEEVAPNPSWTGRRHFEAVNFQDKMWILGGCNASAGRNDVWSSSDGINWTEEVSSAPWQGRCLHNVEVHDGKIWLFGGTTSTSNWLGDHSGGNLLNDVWYSEDGVNWIEYNASADWSPRYSAKSAVFNNKIWLTGGILDDYSHINEIWSYAEYAEIGNSYSAQDTPIEAPPEGEPFRLRATVSADQGDLSAGAGNFKLQYAELGPDAVCTLDFSGGEEYVDIKPQLIGPANWRNIPDSDITLPGGGLATTLTSDDAILVIGHNAGDRVTFVDSSDPDPVNWTEIPNTNVSLPGHSSDVTFTSDDDVLVIGHGAGDRVTFVDSSDPDPANWTEIPNTNVSLPGNGTAATFNSDDTVLVLGHIADDRVTFVDSSDPDPVNWTEIPNTNVSLPGSGFTATFTSNYDILVLAYDDDSDGGVTFVDSSDPDPVNWTEIPNTNISLPGTGYATTFTDDDTVLVLGHTNGDGVTFVDSSDPNPTNWTEITTNISLVGASGLATTFTNNDDILVLTRTGGVTFIDSSDPDPAEWTIIEHDIALPESSYGFYDLVFTSNEETLAVVWTSFMTDAGGVLLIDSTSLNTEPLSFYDNTNIPNGSGIASSPDDPNPGSGNAVMQSYVESNNFTNPNTIPDGDYGIWDFALVDNNAPGETTYCFRIVDSSGGELETYTVIPEITTIPPTFAQGDHRWFENAELEAGMNHGNDNNFPATLDGNWSSYRNARMGPFEYNGNLYVTIDDDEVIVAYKSVDGGVTWDFVDDFITMGLFAYEVVQVESILHVVYLGGASSAPPHGSISIRRFDMETDSWTSTTSSEIYPQSSISGNRNIFLSVRSNGDYVVFYNGPPEDVSGTDYRRIAYSIWDGSDWTTTVPDFQDGDDFHYDARTAVLGESDRIHMFYTWFQPVGAGPVLAVLTLDNSNNISDFANQNATNPFYSYATGAGINVGGTIYLPHKNFISESQDLYGELNLFSRPSDAFTSATFDTITPTLAETTSSNPAAIAHSPDGTIHAFYVRDDNGNIEYTKEETYRTSHIYEEGTEHLKLAYRSVNDASVSFEADHIHLNSGSNHDALVYATVDLTNVDELLVDWEGEPNFDNGVFIAVPVDSIFIQSNNEALVGTGIGEFSRRTDTLDVSYLSGYYKVGVYVPGVNTDVSVYNMSSSDGDVFVATTGDWTEPELFAEADTQGISANYINGAIGVLYNDDGTVKYDRLVLVKPEVGDPLAAQNVPFTLDDPNQAVRLRMLLDVDDKDATAGDFKLQYAPRIGDVCSTDFTGYGYQDLGPSTLTNTYGPNAGSTATNDGFMGTVNWSSPENVISPANESAASIPETMSTRVLKVTGFGFDIPEQAEIVGIEMQFEIGFGGGVAWHPVAYKNGVLASEGYEPSGTEGSYTTAGGEGFLWGEQWTPSDINDSQFGVGIWAENILTGLSTNVSIVHIRAIVYYSQDSSDSIVFHDISNASTGMAFEPSEDDPTSSRDIVSQVYVQSNDFSIVNETPRGATAMFDFSIYDNSELGGNYCFRIVRADGSLLPGYNNIAELGSPPRTIQFMRHGRWFDTAEQARPFYW